MPASPPDYCRYFVVTPESRRWGLGVAAAGRTRIPAGACYPQGQHPEDHHLEWEQGRVLDALQVVLVTEGGGSLETRALGMRRVEAGMVFLLLPGVWHRYRPDPVSGWTESWLETQGPLVDTLLADGVFREDGALLAGEVAAEIEVQMNAIHLSLMTGGDQHPALLAAEVMRVLALCAPSSAPPAEVGHVDRAVRKAAGILAERHAEPVNVEALARELGVAYSHFRRRFKSLTGLSPWRYVIQVRLARARRLLLSGDATLEDIATRVGFSSGFHLSHAFKQVHGVSPSRWRSERFQAASDG